MRLRGGKSVIRIKKIFARMARLADVAQLVEQRIRNAWVGGSTPLVGLFST